MPHTTIAIDNHTVGFDSDHIYNHICVEFDSFYIATSYGFLLKVDTDNNITVMAAPTGIPYVVKKDGDVAKFTHTAPERWILIGDTFL